MLERVTKDILILVYAVELVLGGRYAVLYPGNRITYSGCEVISKKIIIINGFMRRRFFKDEMKKINKCFQWCNCFCRHFRAASISVAVLLVVSWCTTGYIAYLNNHMPKWEPTFCKFFRNNILLNASCIFFLSSMDDPLALFDKIYDKPWTRFGPYLIGMIVGWILYKTDCKIPMKRVSFEKIILKK